MTLKIEKTIYLINIVLLVVVLAFISWFIFASIDMIKDHQCSVTTDIEWYVNNNCIEYYEKSKRVGVYSGR